MKQVTLFVIILLTFGNIYSQTWEKNETDEFTGKLVRITRHENVALTQFYVRFSIGQNGDFQYLIVKHTGGNINNGMCKNGDTKMILKFGSGKTLTLAPTDEIDCGGRLIIYYPMSKEQIDILKDANDIEKFRIYYTDGYKDYNMKKPDYFKRTFAMFQ